jgi:hypothetical protein
MNIYHVAVDSSTAELESLKEVKPPRLLLSYFYFKNKPLNEYIEKLGYQPDIMLDSGAYSAFTKGKGIALTDYMKYIEENKEYITHYFSLDVIGDSEMSYWYYSIMKEKGFDPLPVYHYGSDEKWLKKYIKESIYIGLGGTVPEKSKSKVSDWVRMITWEYPETDFHLLGSTSDKIIDTCDIASVDSSSWFMQAIMGSPKHIKGRTREAKIKRAKYNLKRELETYEGISLPTVNSGS